MPESSLLDIHAEATRLYLDKISKFYNRKSDMFPNQVKDPYKSLNKTLDKIANADLEEPPIAKKLYTRLHNDLDKVAKYEKKKGDYYTQLDGLYLQVYENDNKMHDTIYSSVIKETTNHDSVLDSVEKNTTNPSKLDIRNSENPLNAFFSAMLGIRYNPLKKNNVPYIAFDNSSSGSDRQCLRLGSQIQGAGTVNPTFERYLLANARRGDQRENVKNKDDFKYVYINLLKREQGAQDVVPPKGRAKLLDRFVRFSEGKKSSALEGLNENKDLKAAVVSLPADGGFFLGGFSMVKGESTIEKPENVKDLFNELVGSIKDNRNDFYMSDAVKAKMFGNEFETNIQNNKKLKQCFQDASQSILGPDINDKDNITQEQRSAILFQFVKFNFTNLILEELDPPAYNMSCKDAIDRGGIHTLYYHMNKLYENGTPMLEKDFLKNLDGPALIVKYRPLNHNRNLIWNALDQRMKNDPEFNKKHDWVNDWLKNNTPPDVAAKRVDQAEDKPSPQNNSELSLEGHKVAAKQKPSIQANNEPSGPEMVSQVQNKQKTFLSSHRTYKEQQNERERVLDKKEQSKLASHRSHAEKPRDTNNTLSQQPLRFLASHRAVKRGREAMQDGRQVSKKSPILGEHRDQPEAKRPKSKKN